MSVLSYTKENDPDRGQDVQDLSTKKELPSLDRSRSSDRCVALACEPSDGLLHSCFIAVADQLVVPANGAELTFDFDKAPGAGAIVKFLGQSVNDVHDSCV